MSTSESGSNHDHLADYIHPHPVRAGICSLPDLKKFWLSSYPKFFKRNVREGLCRGGFLSILGEADTPAGMRCYAEYSKLVEEADPARCFTEFSNPRFVIKRHAGLIPKIKV